MVHGYYTDMPHTGDSVVTSLIDRHSFISADNVVDYGYYYVQVYAVDSAGKIRSGQHRNA